jgi:ATP phosphoribosyltransferase
VLRPADIPTYVEYGATDLGVVGKDILLEQERDVYEPLDLKFGACRLVVAQPKDPEHRGKPVAFSALRVATKYPRLAERYFTEHGVEVEIIRLSGSIELAPLAGLCERIVDLVDTGRTLRENGLEEVAQIAPATARLIVNRAALKTKYQQVRGRIDRLAAVVQGGRP